MGYDFTDPVGASPQIHGCQLVNIFFKATDTFVNQRIIDNFSRRSSLRIVIATVTMAFVIGIDCPDVHFIIHLGVPCDFETYIQQVWRAGRVGKD
jgi:ATP-dependent DNA helicase RecQ